MNYFWNIISLETPVCFYSWDYLANFLCNNWQSIIDVVERLCYWIIIPQKRFRMSESQSKVSNEYSIFKKFGYEQVIHNSVLHWCQWFSNCFCPGWVPYLFDWKSSKLKFFEFYKLNDDILESLRKLRLHLGVGSWSEKC